MKPGALTSYDEILAAWRSRPPVVTDRQGRLVQRAKKLLGHFDSQAEFEGFVASLTEFDRAAIREQLTEQDVARHYARR